MKIADLYVRVSTDEQADKGYSQRGQEEMLRKYCGINNIGVRKVIYEDHSAKTFNRPQWLKLLLDLKKSKGKVHLILFTKWDRFSRNAGDAYQMINTLRKIGVEPQAIEQPLDLTIPENKMMLAFYLAAPEVENDRRALNTLHGMRRARKEGRYMGVAPVGYKNRITEDGRKYIEPHEPQASIVKWAFEQVAHGVYGVAEVRRQAVRRGLKCSNSSFWKAIQNPVYFGKIFVPGYKDEESRLVQGQHEALISEELFYQMHDAIDGRKKNKRPNVNEMSNDMFPLRRFLKCPKCDRHLTGSASKGRNARYYYYHCVASCGVRYPNGLVNDQFLKELQKFKPHDGVQTLFELIVRRALKGHTTNSLNEKKEILGQIDQMNGKLAKARELLLTSDIDTMDYKVMKTDIEEKLVRLEARLTEMSKPSGSPLNLEKKILNRAVEALANIDLVYEKADIDQKRDIIGSIFPENLEFSESGYRTAKINEAAALIFQINSELRNEKSRISDKNLSKSGLVPRAGVEPARV
jgi:site-specific DNA recombinase